MAPSINRTAILLTLAAFVGFGIFCEMSQAPLIQQDILRRCQDALLVRHIPLNGLSVNGRDVLLTGPRDSAIVSPETQAVLERISGVRAVEVLSSAEPPGVSNSKGLEPAASAEQKELQEKIDGILENQGIAFKAETAVLTPESEAALDAVAADLAEAPNLRCEVRGFNNGARGARQSMILALQRALATEDYLVTKGIAEWRLSTHAFQAGDSTDGRRTNRAVDLVVKAK